MNFPLATHAPGFDDKAIFGMLLGIAAAVWLIYGDQKKKALGQKSGQTLGQFHRLIGAAMAILIVITALSGLVMNHKTLFWLEPLVDPAVSNRGAEPLDLGKAQEIALRAAGLPPESKTSKLKSVSVDWDREVYIFRFDDPGRTQATLDAWTGEIFDRGPRRAEWWARQIHTGFGGSAALFTDLAAVSLLFLVGSGLYLMREARRQRGGEKAKVVKISGPRPRKKQSEL